MGSTRRNVLALGGLAATVAAGSWLLVGRGPALPADPLEMVPQATTAVAWVNVRAVLGSPIWERIVGGGDQGMRQIERVCGFNPIDEIDELVIAASGDEPTDLDRVGIVARGPLSHEKLVRCVRDVVADDGGSLRQIELDGVPAVAGRGSSRAAFWGSDAIVGGDEETVRAVISVLRRDRGSAAADPTLARLWRRVAAGRQVVLVSHVPERWRSTLRRTVREAGTIDLSPLGGVRAVGLGARVSGGLGLGVALQMRDRTQARAATDTLRAEVDRALADPRVTLSALGPVLRRLQMEAQDGDVVLALELSGLQLADLIDLVEDLWNRDDDRGGRPAPSRAPPEPDTVIRPHE